MPVGRRPIHRGKTQAERAAARRGVCLRGLGITAQTEKRYNAAAAQLLPTLEAVSSLDDLDV